MKVATNLVVGRKYITVVDGVPLIVEAGPYYFEDVNRKRLGTVYELPEPTPATPTTVKVKIEKLRAILREAEKLQADISAVAKGTMRVTFGEHFHMEVGDSSVTATAIRETLLHKLGRELNDLLTLRADPADTDASDEP